MSNLAMMTHTTACMCLVLALTSAPFGHTQAQDSELKHPRKEFVASASGGYFQALKAYDQTGVNQTFDGAVKGGWGLSLADRTWFGTQQKYALNVELGFQNVPFAFKYYTGYSSYLGLPYPDEVQTQPVAHSPQFQIGAGAVRRVELDRTLSLDVLASLHMAWANEWNFLYEGHVPHMISYNDTTRLYLLSMTADMWEDWLPLVKMGCGFSWRLENHNTLSIVLSGQFALGADLVKGNYVLYPGTANESTGRFSYRPNYLGVQVSYAMAYGPPKLPRRLRTDY